MKTKSVHLKQLVNSRHYKESPPHVKLSMMMDVKPLDKLIKDGDVLDIEAVRKQFGYAAWSIRRLCITGKIGHVLLPGGQYVFLPEQVKGAIKSVPARA